MDSSQPGFNKERRSRRIRRLAAMDLERPSQEFRAVVHGCTEASPLRPHIFDTRWLPGACARRLHPRPPIR